MSHAYKQRLDRIAAIARELIDEDDEVTTRVRRRLGAILNLTHTSKRVDIIDAEERVRGQEVP